MGRTSHAKEKLHQVASDLIWDNTYVSVSVNQICQRANVHKGSFYHFFRTKADLAIAAYEMLWQEAQPEHFVGSNRQIGFGAEKVVKAAFVNIGPLANLINADRDVGVIPNQIGSDLMQLFFGVTRSAHGFKLSFQV